MPVLKVGDQEELVALLDELFNPQPADPTPEQIAEARKRLQQASKVLYNTVREAVEKGSPEFLLHIAVDDFRGENTRGAACALILDVLTDFIRRSFEESGEKEFRDHIILCCDFITNKALEEFDERYAKD